MNGALLCRRTAPRSRPGAAAPPWPAALALAWASAVAVANRTLPAATFLAPGGFALPKASSRMLRRLEDDELRPPGGASALSPRNTSLNGWFSRSSI